MVFVIIQFDADLEIRYLDDIPPKLLDGNEPAPPRVEDLPPRAAGEFSVPELDDVVNSGPKQTAEDQPNSKVRNPLGLYPVVDAAAPHRSLGRRRDCH